MNQELEDYKKTLVKKARLSATVFGIMAVTALIVIVYAFFSADMYKRQLEESKKETLDMTVRAEKAEAEIYDLKIKLEKATIEAIMAKAVAEDCGKSKTKK